MWFELENIVMSEKNKEEGGIKKSVRLKWKCISGENIQIVMQFEDELTASEFLKHKHLNMVLGERMNVEMKAPKRLDA